MMRIRDIVAWIVDLLPLPSDHRLAERWRREEDESRSRHQHRHTEQQREKCRSALEVEVDAFLTETNGRPSTPEQWAWYESIRRREAIIG
ncbi:MAG: hypothetical protein KBC02_02745 [Candidatus Pacebacteria bacterium]|nr:hypothetical protein [Candidatus Paceibacterota bacterium]